MKNILTLCFLLFFSHQVRAADAAILQLLTDNDRGEVHPQHDRIGLRLQINRPDGAPVQGARLRLRLEAPPTPWIASTDFPIVEGSQLIDSTVTTDRGEFSLAFVPPIRGVYTFKVDVEPLPGDTSFAASHQEFHTEITENPRKERNLTVLLLILISVGGISGFVLGRDFTRGAVALAIVCISLPASLDAPRAEAHGDEHAKAANEGPQKSHAAANPQGETVELQVLTAEPRVGELASLQARFVNAAGVPQPARFRLRFTQLEHGIEVFSTEVAAADGILNWQGQFYDGSDHRVDVDAVPIDDRFGSAKKSAHADQLVAVEAIAPPPRAIIKSLGFLLTVTALGMLCGIAVGRVWRRNDEVMS